MQGQRQVEPTAMRAIAWLPWAGCLLLQPQASAAKPCLQLYCLSLTLCFCLSWPAGITWVGLTCFSLVLGVWWSQDWAESL